MRLQISNQRVELARVKEGVDQFAAAHGLPSAVLADLQVSLDEILSNIISYGYADTATHEIVIQLAIADGVLHAVIEDDGAPFNPLTVPLPDTGADLSHRAIGGLGIRFIRALNDEVRYERAGDRNRLSLRRNLALPPAPT
ncbi:MAG TPA: ATP-binding protein [Burkholderiales bacterium]|nr:ATP-binding protein [Burkholderiales bacterium]